MSITRVIWEGLEELLLERTELPWSEERERQVTAENARSRLNQDDWSWQGEVVVVVGGADLKQVGAQLSFYSFEIFFFSLQLSQSWKNDKGRGKKMGRKREDVEEAESSG